MSNVYSISVFKFGFQENVTRSPCHPEVMDLTLERVTPINRYFRIRRQQVKIVEPEKKETNDVAIDLNQSMDETNKKLLVAA